VLSFAPRLPAGLTRLEFGLSFRGRCLRVQATPDTAKYTLVGSEPLEIHHHGTAVTVSADEPQQLPIPPAPDLDSPKQPAGRESLRRRPGR
jgi:alpha,alpha-trehalose phosphorylase